MKSDSDRIHRWLRSCMNLAEVGFVISWRQLAHGARGMFTESANPTVFVYLHAFATFFVAIPTIHPKICQTWEQDFTSMELPTQV